jgi:hypothetical protein
MKSWLKWTLGLVGGAVAGGTAYMLAPIVQGAASLASGSLVTLNPFGGTQFQIVGAGTAPNTYAAVDPTGKNAPRAFKAHHILSVIKVSQGNPVLAAPVAGVLAGADKLGAGSVVTVKTTGATRWQLYAAGNTPATKGQYAATDLAALLPPRAISPIDIASIVSSAPSTPLLA